MPGDDEYCLRWNNHQPNLISVFSTLLQNDQMVDVTLFTDNREIHAHKIVLSACSPFFQHIFLRNSCKHPVIVLTGVKYMHMRSLIDFIYNGEVNIHQNDLKELLRLANVLKIKGLDEVSPTDTNDIVVNQPSESATNESQARSDTSDDSTKLDDCDMPSTSDKRKSAKKRKSVSFADPLEIVWDGSIPESSRHANVELRSNICMVTTVSKDNELRNASVDHDDDRHTKPNVNELVVTINPHSLYSYNDSLKAESLYEIPSKKQRPYTIRKMIRKNENFLRALRAVRDEGIGFCKAAKLHGVNNRTLWLEYQKLGYPIKNSRKKQQS